MDSPPNNLSGFVHDVSELTAAEAHTLINELSGALDEFEGVEDRDDLEGGAPIRYRGP